MSQKKRNYLFFEIIFFAVLMVSAGNAQENAQLWVTKDFSQETLVNKTVSVNDDSVMSILNNNARLDTAFGGGFVTGINGILSDSVNGEQKDWFYYVNGLLANVGALQYFPKAGDNVWWDYHRWNDAVYVAAVIGAYPQPFLSGISGKVEPTIIIVSPRLIDTARALQQSLKDQNIAVVDVAEYTPQAVQDNQSYRILIGAWADLENDPQIKDIVKNSHKSGFFIRFDGDGLHPLDMSGNPAQAFKNAAAILAIGGGFAQIPPRWIVTGTSDEEVKKAVDLLISHSERIQFYSGAVVAGNEVVNVPVIGKK